MSAANEQASRFDPGFAREFYAIENGEYAKLCMQCGLCAVTCASRKFMDLPPRKLFKLVQAGDKAAVLESETPWLCTSCMTCTVRCPRGIPIIDVMHGLKYHLIQQGSKAPVALMSKVFADNMLKRGRVFEMALTQSYFLKAYGPVGAIPIALKMRSIGQPMLLKGRLPLKPPKKIKGLDQVHKIVKKATEVMKREGHQDGV